MHIVAIALSGRGQSLQQSENAYSMPNSDKWLLNPIWRCGLKSYVTQPERPAKGCEGHVKGLQIEVGARRAPRLPYFDWAA